VNSPWIPWFLRCTFRILLRISHDRWAGERSTVYYVERDEWIWQIGWTLSFFHSDLGWPLSASRWCGLIDMPCYGNMMESWSVRRSRVRCLSWDGATHRPSKKRISDGLRAYTPPTLTLHGPPVLHARAAVPINAMQLGKKNQSAENYEVADL
jgi:hypothetical protein